VDRSDEPRVLPGWSVPPLDDFGRAVEAVLGYLAQTLPLPTWVVVRVDGEDAVVLGVAGDSAEPVAGSTVRWADSISARMVSTGLRVAPATADVEALRALPSVRDGRVGAYMGVPICRPDGTLFGVLAGIAPRPGPDDLAVHLPVVELLGGLLGGLLAGGLRAATHAREVERVEIEEMYDGVTGLGDRRYWDRVVTAEESRCRRYGDAAAVIVLELDDYGRIADDHGPDATQVLVRRAARVLRTHSREEDVIAHVGPSTFAVLSVGADAHGAATFAGRLQTQLAANAVQATLRYRARDPRHGLEEAWRDAEAGASVDRRRLA
jgi:diguanylate cyclase